MKEIMKIMWHHGTCDCCQRKNILICHFGYDTQPNRDYRLCAICMCEYIQVILFGCHTFEDGLMDIDEYNKNSINIQKRAKGSMGK